MFEQVLKLSARETRGMKRGFLPFIVAGGALLVFLTVSGLGDFLSLQVWAGKLSVCVDDFSVPQKLAVNEFAGNYRELPLDFRDAIAGAWLKAIEAKEHKQGWWLALTLLQQEGNQTRINALLHNNEPETARLFDEAVKNALGVFQGLA